MFPHADYTPAVCVSSDQAPKSPSLLWSNERPAISFSSTALSPQRVWLNEVELGRLRVGILRMRHPACKKRMLAYLLVSLVKCWQAGWHQKIDAASKNRCLHVWVNFVHLGIFGSYYMSGSQNM